MFKHINVMLSKKKDYYKKFQGKNLLLFVVIISIQIGCSPVPMIQSPRVKSAVSLGMNSIADKKIDADINPYYLKLGILNRIEISGFVMPFITSSAVTGNIKVFLFEYGKPTLFKNVSTAIFTGKKIVLGEWDKSNTVYAGPIFATRQTFDNSEIELIFQPAYYRNDINSSWDDGSGKYELISGLHLNGGFINTLNSNPDNRFSFDLLFGAGYKYTISNYTKNLHHDTVTVVNTSNRSYNNWVWQFGLAFNWKSRR